MSTVVKVGDIFRNSWGYEQTTVDFYQVVRVSAKSVWVRRIKGDTAVTCPAKQYINN